MTLLDLGWVGRSTYAPGSSFGPYRAATHELVWIEHGGAMLEVAGESHPLRARSVVLSRPGEVNLYRWDPVHETQHGWLHLTVHDGVAPCPRVRHFAQPQVVHALLGHVGWLERQRPVGWRDLAADALRYTLRLFVSGSMDEVVTARPPLPAAVERALQHVADDWRGSPTLLSPRLGELAEAASVTPEHLSRSCAQALGRGPIGLLRLVRLRHTASLLARGELPVGLIARRGGFESPFHFSRAFKQEYGVSPSAFRDQPRPGPDLPPTIQEMFAAWL